MRRSKLLFILFQVILKFLEIYLLKNIKIQRDEFLYDKAWIPTRAIYDIYIRKTFTHICYLFCIEFSQTLLMPYERFVMLLKLRSHTHHLNMHYTYTGGRCKNHAIPFRFTQKCFTLTLGVNTKTCLIDFSSTK